jgi:hypothetical protein
MQQAENKLTGGTLCDVKFVDMFSMRVKSLKIAKDAWDQVVK